jgi:ribosomal protein S12 methylthiotransferase accessory factor
VFTSINRPYKERDAQATIALLKKLLATFDLLPAETFQANPYSGIYSVSLELSEDKGSFRSNGKGRTVDFCLASAYAEFVERMQNSLFAIFPRTIVTELKEAYGFYHMPDERYLGAEEFSALPLPIVQDIIHYSGAGRMEFMFAYFERVKANGVPGVVAVPFFDTQNNQVCYLPFNLLLLTVGSNGMAAGNTHAEAIFQALCELLERWGAAEVFYNQLVPPTVPREYLKQFEDEYAIISEIERSGKYQLTVKDFSAQRRIPSLGLIVENKNAHTYRLNVGSDTCFQVALSRCLTEVYQGILDENMFDACTIPIPQEEATYFVNNDERSLYQRYMVFAKFTKDNSGPFPLSLFRDQPSYAFDPTIWTSKTSYEAEVRKLVSYFHEMGYNVYIRDVSFLGFPSVFVYVPEVSAEGRKNVPPLVKGAPTSIMLELDRIESKVLKLKNCSAEDLLDIAHTFENFDAAICLVDLFGIKLKDSSLWKQINMAFLLTQIWYSLGYFEKANESFKKFLQTRTTKNLYYEFVEKYLEWLTEGLSTQAAFDRLLQEVDAKDIARQVGEDLSDPKQAFSLIKLPNCPDCKTCELYTDCLTTGRVTMANILYPSMLRTAIDQQALSWLV